MNSMRRICHFCARYMSEAGDSTKRVDVAIVGHPNAGKSTLVNTLCGRSVMPVSSKVHMTRFLMKGFLTEGDSQLIFWDSPGFVSKDIGRRHKVPQKVIEDARFTFLHCDLVVLLVDIGDPMHTRFIPKHIKAYLRQLDEAVSAGDKDVVLVLNKFDTFKGKRSELDRIIGTLTGNTLGYQKTTELKSSLEPITRGGLFATTSNLKLNRARLDTAINDRTRGESANQEVALSKDVVEEIDEDVDEDKYLENLKGRRPHKGYDRFSAVFPISAINGYGLEELKSYMLSRARPGSFEVEDGVRTNMSTEKVVENAILSQVYECLDRHLPYQFNVELQDIFQSAEDHCVIIAVLHVCHLTTIHHTKFH